MSTSSSKTAVICEKPNFETDRTSLRPGSPLIDCSSGNVTRRSISSGESEGAVVFTVTCTGVVSGKASNGSSRSE